MTCRHHLRLYRGQMVLAGILGGVMLGHGPDPVLNGLFILNLACVIGNLGLWVHAHNEGRCWE